MGLISQLLKLDNYYRPINLRFKQDSSHRTCLGWVFTFILGFIFISSAYFFSRDIIDRNNPETNTIRSIDINPETIYFTEESLPMAFALQNSTTWRNWIDESIYYVEVTQQSLRKEKKPNETQFENILETNTYRMIPCDRQRNFAQIPELNQFTEKKIIENFYCFNYTEAIPQTGGHAELAEVYHSFSVSYKKCSNETRRNESYVCQPKELINERLRQGLIFIHYTDYSIDTSNFNDPFIPYLDNYWTVFSQESPKSIGLIFKHSSVQTDQGYLLEDYTNFTQPVFEKSRQMIMSTGDEKFLDIAFSPPRIKEKKIRIYKKIQKVFAEIGGFIQLCNMIIIVLISSYIEIDYYVEFINEIFTFDKRLGKKQSKKSQDEFLKDSKAQKSQQTMKLKSLWTSKQDKILTKEEKKKISKEIFLLMNDNNKLNLSRTEQLLFYLGGVNEKKQELFEASQKLLDQRLDVVFLMNKIIEIDQLKFLLLNQEQRCLFDFIPKPSMNHQNLETIEDIKYDSIMKNQETQENLCFEAYFSYQNLKQQEYSQRSQLDNNIMKNLDQKTLYIFQLLHQYDQKQNIQIQNGVSCDIQTDQQQQKLVLNGNQSDFLYPSKIVVDEQMNSSTHHKGGDTQYNLEIVV